MRGVTVRPLQPRINRLAFERQHAEHAFMHTPKRLARHETLERLVAERKLTDGQVALAGHAAFAQAHKMVRRVIFRAVDDAQILAAANL